MNPDLSPKQVARAIGVSESSLKRWCDRGLLPTVKTAGGHRRLPLAGVLQFLKDTGRELAEPEVLGLPSAVGSGTRVLATACGQFAESLLEGQEEVARQIVLDLFLARHPLAVICDEVIAKALYEIGDQWECGDADVYEERRGCGITLRILHELRRLLPETPPGQIALGGTCEGDHYQIPTTMVELVLRENGYRACSLGSNIPFASLAASIEEQRPKLFWLSVTEIGDAKLFLEQYARLFEMASKRNVPLVVGGRGLSQDLRLKMQYSAFCDTLQHLETFLKHTRTGIANA